MWTEQEDAKLLELWQSGHSANVIAMALGGKSRNAILGRVYRIRGKGEHKDLRFGGYPKIHISGGARNVAERKPRLYQGARTKRPKRDDYQDKEPVSLAGPAIAPLPRSPEPPPLVLLQGNEVVPDGTPATLLQLCSAACKWPVNDGNPFLFCNRHRRGGSPYCDEHFSQVWAPLRGRPSDPAYRTAIDTPRRAGI